ncbi:hypothetical protein [Mycobacterium colombiense]|uniref:hypothetical protein n=1 Tax=Mycobacterium colombiense TaxID=339268 RepID=UPI00096CBA43|nr:hypothetical protein [Mycobacterium colombiense]OMB93209.1 hypothetical protein A5732_16800 [Mycobacterium colombiense]
MRRVIVDRARSACLCDVGLPAVDASVCVDEDGSTTFVLIDATRLGDERFTYNPTTPQAPHEQLGPLPIEFIRRIAIARRRHLTTGHTTHCGRRTKSGTPCRIPVMFLGEACHWHKPAARPVRHLESEDER